MIIYAKLMREYFSFLGLAAKRKKKAQIPVLCKHEKLLVFAQGYNFLLYG